MSVKDQYGLKFAKIKTSGFSDYFDCDADASVPGSPYLASLLRNVRDYESVFLLDEVNLAITGSGFEDEYIPDVGDDRVEFSPPNATITGAHTMTLLDLKELLEEWIAFVQN